VHLRNHAAPQCCAAARQVGSARPLPRHYTPPDALSSMTACILMRILSFLRVLGPFRGKHAQKQHQITRDVIRSEVHSLVSKGHSSELTCNLWSKHTGMCACQQPLWCFRAIRDRLVLKQLLPECRRWMTPNGAVLEVHCASDSHTFQGPIYRAAKLAHVKGPPVLHWLTVWSGDNALTAQA